MSTPPEYDGNLREYLADQLDQRWVWESDLVAKQAADMLRAGEPGSCTWTEDDEGTWFPSCGDHPYAFNEGSPVENGHVYCHACGKPLVTVKYVPPWEREE